MWEHGYRRARQTLSKVVTDLGCELLVSHLCTLADQGKQGCVDRAGSGSTKGEELCTATYLILS